MSGTQDAARLREALANVLKEGAGLTLPPLNDSVLVARLRAACAGFAGVHDRPSLSVQEMLAAAEGERFDPTCRNLLLETFSEKDTAFFRDKQRFARITDALFARNTKKTITIWCAACSTGQEALSLAIAWHKRLQKDAAIEETGRRLVVYASDLSARAVKQARVGRYNNFDVQHGLNVHDLLGFFDEQQGGGFWKAKDFLLSHTTFFQHNLLHSPPSFLPRRLDAVFVPYTLKNFHALCVERVLARMVALLAPDGWLVLAPCEAEHDASKLFAQRSSVFSSGFSLPTGVFSRRAFLLPDRGEGVVLSHPSQQEAIQTSPHPQEKP